MTHSITGVVFRAFSLPALLVATLVAAPTLSRADAPTRPQVEFNRDIRPILSDTCFACHGPDKAKRKADLRLDTEDGAFADRGGYRPLVPGKPEQSELYQRITAALPSERMPPARSGRKLTTKQIELIRHWIEQGAKWQKHWAFLPPRREPLAKVRNTTWGRNGIDAWVLERLEREGLSPSPEADRATLIRRVTLDLTGLPPTPAEVDAFLADRSPGAYEKVVDRLLASPRYGERMAVLWLDAARYADSNGYQSDGERIMWRWRDWVLDAFNANMPFDQFTIEQLAGDLLPRPTLEQRIATGFNRNHRGNAEGGIIPEEYAVEYVVDRVDTTATVWLGVTLGCARCHSHKYDPFTQKEYYQLFAFFNNVPERGKAIKYGNSPPMIKSPTRAQQEQLRHLDDRLRSAEQAWEGLRAETDRAQSEWEKGLPSSPAVRWTFSKGLLARYPLDGDMTDATGHGRPGKVEGGAACFVPGRVGRAADFDGKRFVNAGDVGNFGFYDKFSLSAWIQPRGGEGVIVSRAEDSDRGHGYALQLAGGRLQLNLVQRWLDDALRVETLRRLQPGRWHHVVATYDGSRVASGVRLYVDGRPEQLKVNLDDLNQTFDTKEPLRIGGGGGPANRFRGALADVRVWDRCLSADEAELVATPDAIADILAIAPAKRTPPQARKLRACYLDHPARQHLREAWWKVLALREERARLFESFPTTMVMVELPKPRDAHLLIRGQYDRPGEKVTPNVPAILPPLLERRGVSPPVRPDRLALARWLVNGANPLTGRVVVNRYWQMFFGTGLVKTAEDFGLQGESPSHPELLDWLATEFVRVGWDVKAMHRLIVTSATYRQSARVSAELIRRDPSNRLLARGPRLRLSAEMLRDQALFVSGLLAERVGGPSVKPYQPKGLWEELASIPYKQDQGESLYRRSLYTFWKRTVAPPSMMTFDATAREACTVNRSRTNTPLQALTLMNDVTFVEASRSLAERILREGGATPGERLAWAFRVATSRPPRPAELAVLRAGLDYHRAHYRQDRAAATELVRQGESKPDSRLDVGELAAYTTVMGLILNLDEVLSRE
ncbi:MAG: DUF1553 domain-containing protein [Planctomycetes bacterium]|nr:DUF1553 domain-containing protein [Planctomycetota bacterium]